MAPMIQIGKKKIGEPRTVASEKRTDNNEQLT